MKIIENVEYNKITRMGSCAGVANLIFVFCMLQTSQEFTLVYFVHHDVYSSVGSEEFLCWWGCSMQYTELVLLLLWSISV